VSTGQGQEEEISRARAAAADLTAQARDLVARMGALRIAATAADDQALAFARHARRRAEAFARRASREVLDGIGPLPNDEGDGGA
jgi:hypothetical protein